VRRREGLKAMTETFHNTPSLRNISSSVLNATGLTRYPSTPASNALLLSSRDDIPVRANIRVRVEAPVVSCWWDSNFRIADVAPTPNSSCKKIGYRRWNVNKDKPSSTGIERSRRTTLAKSESHKIDWRNNDRPTQTALLFHRFQHLHVHQLQIGSHNPNI